MESTEADKGEYGMHTIGKIGVIMPEIIDPLNYELLNGIYDSAKCFGYDVLVFTGVFNSQSEFRYDSHMIGFDNIYELAGRGELDGILYAADLFYNQQTKAHIYRILQKTDTPCLVLGESHPDFPSVFTSQRESMRLLTEHLIAVHQYRDFYYVGGIPGHFDSEERLAGFLDAVRNAGISWDESRQFDGYFWKEEPRRLAQRIAQGTLPRPEAIVCANDVMAAAVCDTLMYYGIRVPEEIAVTGFDGSWESYAHTPQITTISGKYYQTGAEAVERMHMLLRGKSVQSMVQRCQKIRFGGSCGCGGCSGAEKMHSTLQNYICHRINRTLEQKKYIAADLAYYMNDAENLEELIAKVDSSGTVLPGWSWMDLCLCSDWMSDFDEPSAYRKSGFTETMTLALSKRYPENNRDGYFFPVQQLLPALQQPHTPKLVVFTSLHAQGRIFGYAVTAYENAAGVFVDEHYVNWLDAIGNGLYSLQQRLYLEYLKRQTEQQSVHDPATGLYNRRGFLVRVPDFLSSCRTEKKLPYLLLLSNADREISQTGVETSLVIANAMRLSASKDEVYARVEEHVFAVLLAAADAPESRRMMEKRILAIEIKMQYLQGKTVGMHQLELLSEFCFLSEATLPVEKILDRQLVRITEKASAECPGDYRIQLQRLRREIYLEPQADWNVNETLRRIGISRSHFHRMYRQQFEVSYTEDIILARLDKAQQLLMHTTLQVQEIADQCGYSNVNHFMRQFKERFGVTPSRYRKDCA